MRKKIPTRGVRAPLQSPFAALNPGSFPDAPCGPSAEVEARPSRSPHARRHRVVLRREKARRGGRTVVVVGGLPTHLSQPEIEALARRARRALGCGGAVAGREIEIQGDQPERLRTFLATEGFEAAGPG